MKHRLPFATPERKRRALLHGAGALILAPWLATPTRAAGLASRADLLSALAAGGLVVYFRHGATNKGGVDRIEWPRSRQRLLSAEGEAQARAVGEVFRRHRIGLEDVLASPFARCHDFAHIAFGRVQDDRQLLGLLSQDSERQQRIDHSLALLRKPVPRGANRVLVGHSSNIQETTGVFLPEGGAVLARPGSGADKGFTVLGEWPPAEWAALARA